MLKLFLCNNQFYFTCSGSVIILKTIIVRLMKTHRYVAIILKSWIENWSKSFKSYNPKTKREKKQTPKQTKQNKTYKTKPKKNLLGEVNCTSSPPPCDINTSWWIYSGSCNIHDIVYQRSRTTREWFWYWQSDPKSIICKIFCFNVVDLKYHWISN